MIIKFGEGNSYTAAFDASDKTLIISGLFGVDVTPSNLTVYNVTRSAFMLGGSSTATATVSHIIAAGLPVFTVALSAVPANSADADVLVISLDLATNIATSLASIVAAENTTA